MSEEQQNQIDSSVITEQVAYLAHVMHFQMQANNSSFALPDEQSLSLSTYGTGQTKEIKIEAVLKSSTSLVSEPTLRKRLCAALKSASRDLTEISKVVVAVCLPLSLSQHPIVPLDTVLYAGVALIIFSAGVSGFCPETDSKK